MNQKLKLIKNLLEKRSARRKEKLFVVEGPHLVEEALLRSFGASEGDAGNLIKFFFYSENMPLVKKLDSQGSVGIRISRAELEAVSQVETPQGILAIVRQLKSTFNDVLNAHRPLIVFCSGVQDPGNLGTIIRSADAFGASGVVLSKGTVDLYNPKVVRATMGSLFHLPIVTVEDELEALKQLKEKNVKIIATEASAKLTCSDSDLKGPLAILIGNEGAGLLPEIRNMADESIRIPMNGKAESLNAGVSAGVILYEAIRQRTHGK